MAEKRNAGTGTLVTDRRTSARQQRATKSVNRKAARAAAPSECGKQRRRSFGGSAERPVPTHEEIAGRAYELWLQNGCPTGRDLDHWREAEAQLLAQL